MPVKIWNEDDQGNTYRVIDTTTYIYSGKASSRCKKELNDYLSGNPGSKLGRDWAVVSVNSISTQPKDPKDYEPIRICASARKCKDYRTRMALSKRDASM